MASPLPATYPHIVLFLFMAKGHTILVLHLAQLLHQRHCHVTIFNTKANRPFISQFLAHTDVSILDLPFPENIDGIPKGVESTDKLPFMSLFVPFVNATKLMQSHFEQVLETLPKVSCVVSDGFLSWTLESASKFAIPRLFFSGRNNSSEFVTNYVGTNRLLSGPASDNNLITLIHFPWVKVITNDLDEPLNQPEQKAPLMDLIKEQWLATSQSYGLIVNSFYELEQLYVDHWNREFKPKAWCVGPLCLAESPKVGLQFQQKPKWVEWLDQNLAEGRSVLYIAFGTQAEISQEQLREIAKGLEEPKMNFLWVIRKCESDFIDELKERFGERGMVVIEWVDQREILSHESVQGFVSHCGWNSVLESICAEVPILAWPMMAEQHVNARMVVEEIKVGLRVETCDGSVRGFVNWEILEKMVRELMEGDFGKNVRNKVRAVGEAAREAMKEDGSSWITLNQLIDEICAPYV